MGLILLLDNNENWKIKPENIFKYINESFELIKPEPIQDKSRPYSFYFTIGNKIEGYLHKKGDSIHLEGDFEKICQLALTLRSFIPTNEKVLFFDDSYNNCIELTQKTDINEIIQTLST